MAEWADSMAEWAGSMAEWADSTVAVLRGQDFAADLGDSVAVSFPVDLGASAAVSFQGTVLASDLGFPVTGPITAQDGVIPTMLTQLTRIHTITRTQMIIHTHILIRTHMFIRTHTPMFIHHVKVSSALV